MLKFKYGRGYIQIRTPFETVQFPRINRVFPGLLANDIVPVQPMNNIGLDELRRIRNEFIKKHWRFKYGK